MLMHRQLGFRFPIDSFDEIGACCSNSEIQRCKRCAAVHFASDIIGLGSGAFLQTNNNYGRLHLKYNNLNKDKKELTKVMRGLTVGLLILLDYLCLCIQLYILLSPYFCFISSVYMY